MGLITKNFSFAAGATIIASEHNDNFDTIYNLVNGQLSNVNIASDAAIANSKLNLAAITQAITFSGATTFSSDITFAGQTIADLGTVTTAAFTAITDLGTVTTANIDGGTLDGVQIGGTTATGELIVNNATDDADGLGSQGTSGQFLTSAGTGVNPTWSSAGFLVFAWSGVDNANSAQYGFYSGTNQKVDAGTGVTYAYLVSDRGTAQTLLNFKFVKTASVNTITINARLWAALTGVNEEAILTVTVGGQSNTVKSVTSDAPAWVTASTIDVSGLTTGTTYDGTVALHDDTAGVDAYCSAVTLTGS